MIQRRTFLIALGGLLFTAPAGRRLLATQAQTEAQLWNVQKVRATSALTFWTKFLGLREGQQNTEALSDQYRDHWLCLIRAVSWVESKHGTAGANQPVRDPMQAGNPADAWWKSLTHQSGNSDRFVRGPGLTPNYWAHELPDATKNRAGFPANGKLGKLTDVKKGHKDAGFNPEMSYMWGVVYLLHRTNTQTSSGRTFKCGVYSKDRLMKGAVAYNGGGDPMYKNKIQQALGGQIGCSLP